MRACNGTHAWVCLHFSTDFTYMLTMDPGAHIHTCRFCGYDELMHSVWQRHNAFIGDDDTGGSCLISMLKHLNT